MPLAAPRILFALLGLALGAGASAATVEKLTVDGKSVTLKVPAQAAAGQPWLWVGEFGGHLKSLEDGLVARGWHIVYVRVSNQFGSARAMATWEKVYAELRAQRGLSARPALLGISRGGLYVTAWARRHPDRLSVLYLDNAVCDIRSWPGGFALTRQSKGSPRDWALYKTEFGFANDDDAKAQSPRPAAGLLPTVKAGVLLLSCHGTADQTVPFEDNAAPVIQLWQDHGGRVKLFPKPGGDHHPHGLPNPQPLIEVLTAEVQ